MTESRALTVISTRMRITRAAQKMKQTDLARRMKVSQSTVAQIELEQKAPSLETLLKIANALKIEPHMMLVPAEIK